MIQLSKICPKYVFCFQKSLYLQRYRNEIGIIRMKKVLLFILLLVSLSAAAQQRQISYIDNDGNWYHVYDTDGKKITTLSKHSVGELVGWSAEIIVTKSGVWYRVLDPQGKNISTMSEHTLGTVISVSGSTFTCRSGNWITIRDKNCKVISTRAAN